MIMKLARFVFQKSKTTVERCIPPSVFKYAFLSGKDKYEQILIMVFYEGFEVWCFADPTSNSPEL